MSLLKRLFGGGSQASKEEAASDPAVTHKEFSIKPTPFSEDGQFQTCGIISKDVDGEMKEHRFVRADRFASRDDAVETTIRKARQLIDEQGESIFEQRAP